MQWFVYSCVTLSFFLFFWGVKILVFVEHQLSMGSCQGCHLLKLFTGTLLMALDMNLWLAVSWMGPDVWCNVNAFITIFFIVIPILIGGFTNVIIKGYSVNTLFLIIKQCLCLRLLLFLNFKIEGSSGRDCSYK